MIEVGEADDGLACNEKRDSRHLQNVNDGPDREARFERVYRLTPQVRAYARRRGSADPDALAADVMTIAWSKLAAIPDPDPRPWLYATARNLLLAEHRQLTRRVQAQRDWVIEDRLAPAGEHLDPSVRQALLDISPSDREALLLIAWEGLTPKLAADSLGLSSVTFRVRFHRAKRRFEQRLREQRLAPEIAACWGIQ